VAQGGVINYPNTIIDGGDREVNSLTTVLDPQALPWQIRPLIAVLSKIREGTLTLTTPEGYQLRFGDGSAPHADVQFKKWSALKRIFRGGDVGLAECYRDSEVSCSDLTMLLRLALRNRSALDEAFQRNRLLNIFYRMRHLLRPNSRRGSSRNIEAHYDLGNDFYRLWLDDSMTYSSARFRDGLGGDLTKAQGYKYQRMMEMAGAKPGDRILEIGCGWGGFAEYAAGAGNEIDGVTLSPSQLDYARNRILEAGLQKQVSLLLKDYRVLSGKYDHIVSIEMFEAVGEAYWERYFAKLNQLLNMGGRAAIQTIVIRDDLFEHYRRRSDFIQQYIFPGGMLPSPARLSDLARNHGFEIEATEAFADDYAETLRRWRRKFLANRDQVLASGFDMGFIRLWEFYLAYCETGFDEGRIDVIQCALVKVREA
jgi:cyclopropane-fatty-acyl-phospholipid synthase